MPTVYFDSGGAATNSGTSDNAAPDLNGTATATVVANTTFVDANVNVGANTVNVATHGYTAGTGVELTSSGTLPAGLTLTTLYFIGVIDANNISFHRFLADAIAGANLVDITAAAGGGTHTIRNMTLNIAGGVDLSGVKCSACRVTTTGTSHVFTMLGGVHGFSNGDAVMFNISTGGTIATGLTSGSTLYVNALSATTFRAYGQRSQAIAGGASGLNVSAAETRTMHVRSLERDSGGQQSAINLPASTVTNRKIFWVYAVDNTNDLIVVDVVVTGLGAGADWAIGGQLNAAGFVDGCNSMRNGDTVWFNTDIVANPLNGVIRGTTMMASNFNPGGAFIRFYGKAGARRLIANQGNGTLIEHNYTGLTAAWYAENLELQSQGTGAVVTKPLGTTTGVAYDIRSTDGAATQWGFNNPFFIIASELTGCSAGTVLEGISHIIDTWVHDNTTPTLVWRSQTGFGSGCNVAFNSIFERNAAACASGQGNDCGMLMVGCTVYRQDNTGFTRANVEARTMYAFLRNIIKDNGNIASEFNFSLLPNAAAGTDGMAGYTGVWLEKDNVVSIAGARGGGNTNMTMTLDASTITTDPLFVDPDNVTPADRDFSLQAASPALVPFSFLGSNIEYTIALGAVQNQGETPAVVDGNITHVNGISVTGSGTEPDPWGPDAVTAPPQDVNVVSVVGIPVVGSGTEADPWGP
jgi:hypothetical protein